MRVSRSTVGISQFLGRRLNPLLLTLRICLIERDPAVKAAYSVVRKELCDAAYPTQSSQLGVHIKTTILTNIVQEALNGTITARPLPIGT
ncbi:hypothetical protein LguiB_020947 [Lonicera macranthoides]